MKPHREIRVTLQPSGRHVYALPGTTVLEAAAQGGIILQTPCGGRGTCGKCRIRVVSGSARARTEAAALPPDLKARGFGLACQTQVDGDAVIEIPEESRFESRPQILVSDAAVHGRLCPALRKLRFELPAPTERDTRSDVARLSAALGAEAVVPAEWIRALPAFLRQNRWQGTAVLHGAELLALEPGDTTGATLGVAFDIGTTTVVGTLMDLDSGRELAVAARLNGQVPFGDDVVSRIKRIREDPGALAELQQAVAQTANDIIADLCQSARTPPDRIYEITAAGNSTMQQILCGFDPSALGEVPFVQVFSAATTLRASALGLRAHPHARVYVFPQVESFVGGDTVAGMVAARLDQWDRPVMLVDIGTNGEIALFRDGRILTASTAAGPAFEGARITQGMRAASGAIEKILIDHDVQYNVIGNAKPAGLCGTALIDAVAGLLRTGLVDATGCLGSPEELRGRVPEGLVSRLIERDGHGGFVLARAEETAFSEPVCLWQRDIRELQLASAAIRAGIAILLRRAGVAAGDLGALLLAGAFGNFIRRNNACRIGLLPPIPCDRIRFIGNAASMGAKLALLSVDERRYAEALRARSEHVDLSLDPDFQAEFSASMLFPDPDPNACNEEESRP